MRALTHWILGLFISPVGIVVLAALDSTLFFTLPLGIDAAVVILAVRTRDFTWLVPLLATAGSMGGAALTFWMGVEIGEHGLDRYIPPRRLESVRRRVKKSGAVALAVLDLIPPPFPFTGFVLVAGALEVKPTFFFITLAICRIVRFGLETILAVLYGRRILSWLESDLVYNVIGGLAVAATAFTIISIVRLIRTRSPRARHRAA